MSVETIQKKDWAAKVTGSENPVLVKFGAGWCGPCKMLAPILEDIASARTDVTIVEVDIDDSENDGIHGTFGVRGVPTMILLDKGQEKSRLVGGQTRQNVIDFIDSNI